MALSKALNRKANVAQAGTGLDLDDAVPHGFVGQLRQTLGRDGHIAHQKHATGVAMPTVFDDGDVDVDRVAFFQRLVIGNAVAHLMVDGGADGLGIGVVARRVVVQRRRNGLLNLRDVVVAQLVELVGRHARHHVRGEEIENFGGQFARDTHALCALGVFDGDGHGMDYPIQLG